MYTSKRSQIWIGIVTAAVLLPAISVWYPVIARAGPAESSAAEMLQDGLDALSDQQRDVAVQVFEQLILGFPDTPESNRAENELRALNAAMQKPPETDDGGETAVGTGDAADKALRLKFAGAVGDRVFFAENSAVIGGRARALLENQARWLTARPELDLTIIGRADDGGPEAEARQLSLKRAEAVREKLISSGIAATRLSIDARGSGDPVATCRLVICQAQNRQAETLIGHAPVVGSRVFGQVKLRSGGSGALGTVSAAPRGGVTVSR